MTSVQDFLQLITRMKFTDVLDILLVAYLFYKLLPLLHTTGISRIARVVLTVLVLALVSSALNLHTMNFLISELLTVGLVAIVVLFQPELRRMLDHLGSVKFQSIFGGERTQQDIDPVIAQTVMACEVMSRERVGALIVFERSTLLDEYAKTGTPIDGRVSEQLLRNIFFPKAALHDGAMIIQQGRVAAAGCVLPLSDSTRLSADLGTRHRAGVGMSEATDAVVVIVSEETGAISVATGGILKRHLAPQTLSRLLRHELCDEEETDDGLVVKLRQKLKKGKEERNVKK